MSRPPKKAKRAREARRAPSRLALSSRRRDLALVKPKKKTAQARPLDIGALGVVASALQSAAYGFELGAQKTRDEASAVEMTREAASLRAGVELVVVAAKTAGVDLQARVRMSDRLRWEWVASTAMMLDGRVEPRVLLECTRVLDEIAPLLRADPGLPIALRAPIHARLRVARSTATSPAPSMADPADLAFAT